MIKYPLYVTLDTNIFDANKLDFSKESTLGLRQDQVASLVGVNKNTMCSYENDVRQPSYEILVRLATIYRVSTDYLLGCESKRTVDVSGLTPKEIQTITELVANMTEKNKKLEGL